MIRNRIKSDKDHDICLRCYRSATSTIEFTANLLPVPKDLVVGARCLEPTSIAPNCRISDAGRDILAARLAETGTKNDPAFETDESALAGSRKEGA